MNVHHIYARKNCKCYSAQCIKAKLDLVHILNTIPNCHGHRISTFYNVSQSKIGIAYRIA